MVRMVPFKAEAVEESFGENGVTGLIGVDAVFGEASCGSMLEVSIERRLGVDTGQVEFAREAFNDPAIVVHLLPHRVGGVGLNKEGGGEEGLRCWGGALKKGAVGGFENFRGYRGGVVRGIELTPDVIDTDHDGEPVGLMLENIALPTLLEIGDAIAVDPGVEDANRGLRVVRAKEPVYLRDIALSQGGVITERTGAPAIGYGIAGKEQRFFCLNFEHLSSDTGGRRSGKRGSRHPRGRRCQRRARNWDERRGLLRHYACRREYGALRRD